MALGGRIVVIGVGGTGGKVELNLLALMGSRSTVGGSTLRSRTLEEKAAVSAAVADHVLPLLAADTVVVPVADRFPMADGGRGVRPVRGRAASSGRSSSPTAETPPTGGPGVSGRR